MTKPKASLENNGKESSFIEGRGKLRGAVINKNYHWSKLGAQSGFSFAEL